MAPKQKSPEISTMSFSGLDIENGQEVFSKLKDLLLPCMAELSARDVEVVRREIRGPTLSLHYRVQAECRFDGAGLDCEILFNEGLFLMLRCIAQAVSLSSSLAAGKLSEGKLPLPVRDSPSRGEALKTLEATLDRLWLKPEDPMGMWDFLDKSSMFRKGYIRPLAEVLASFHPSEEQRKWVRQLVLSASLFMLAHELGHYVIRAKRGPSELRALADAVRQMGWQVYEEWREEWAEAWGVELFADLEASNLLMLFGQRAAKGEVPGMSNPEDRDVFVVQFAVANYLGAFFALGALHLLETYGWARYGKPYFSPEHPPAYRRREFLVRAMPPQAVLLVTYYGELLWTELESLLGDILTRLDREHQLAVSGPKKKDILGHLTSAHERFKKNYLEGRIARQVQDLRKQLESERAGRSKP